PSVIPSWGHPNSPDRFSSSSPMVLPVHDAGSKTSLTLEPFGTGDPAGGCCLTSLPVPSTTGTRPAAPTRRTASRAPIPPASGTFTELGSGGPMGAGGPAGDGGGPFSAGPGGGFCGSGPFIATRLASA